MTAVSSPRERPQVRNVDPYERKRRLAMKQAEGSQHGADISRTASEARAARTE